MSVEGSRPGVEVLPIQLVLMCPACKRQHVDEGEWATKWHKTHLCAWCKHEWRPYPFPTAGVASDVFRSPAAEIDVWRAVKLSFLKNLDWYSITPAVHEVVYKYMFRSLTRGRVPSLMIVADAFMGIMPVPQCGYLGCDMVEEHVH